MSCQVSESTVTIRRTSTRTRLITVVAASLSNSGDAWERNRAGDLVPSLQHTFKHTGVIPSEKLSACSC